MLGTYLLIFLLGCLTGAVAGEYARRRRQRMLAEKLLRAIDSGQLGDFHKGSNSAPLEPESTDGR